VKVPFDVPFCLIVIVPLPISPATATLLPFHNKLPLPPPIANPVLYAVPFKLAKTKVPSV